MVTRSPNYPSMDLMAAVALVAPVWKAERRNRMGKMTLAKHLGYTSISGRSLAKFGVLRQYGLIEGTADEIRVTNDAMICLEAPQGSTERQEALERAATNPPLYKEIRAAFPDSLPSESNLTFWLIKKNYTPEAAGKAARSYLATMQLVTGSATQYTPGNKEPEDEVPEIAEETTKPKAAKTALMAPQLGQRQAVFPLDEGDVTLIFPADLSSDGYAELKAYLEIFLNKEARKKQREEAREDSDAVSEAKH